ncbi:hypothetical protein [Streptomyces xantholiticus]|uniref:Uncharacterized protein n=1 Tax=Streptomyces xantholiticus TaxID=68285 RepID=A0ABV1UML3_9ACTN|nr:hypothetical protein CGZ69_03205 [Streptomyces peucetius subsp. caesius ATCC 27952]
MHNEKPRISRRSVLAGLTGALTAAVSLNTARHSTAQAATAAAPSAPPPPHPSYQAIVGLL